MEPEKSPFPPETNPTRGTEPASPTVATQPVSPEPASGIGWVFIGPQGLRAGWSMLVFLLLFNPFGRGRAAGILRPLVFTAMAYLGLIGKNDEFTPQTVFLGELGALLALVIAVALVGVIERRRILDYNLRGSRRPQHFLFGILCGFAALSALAGGLVAGGWMHIDHGTVSGADVFKFALLWGCAFLLGGCLEEGTFRCYGLFTLARGINFWWAFGILAIVCGYQAVFVRGTASWGVYIAALLGFVPCLILHQKASPSSGFWCAAWVTSTLFGKVHVGNPGEAWIGIFSAAFIGFVFCVSIRITGSAWWAIGCHAAWDWAETYFYGTADSGLKPHGSFLTSTSTGNPLWSGGAVGPEGSLLVLGVILLLLAVLLIYGRFNSSMGSVSAAPRVAD